MAALFFCYSGILSYSARSFLPESLSVIFYNNYNKTCMIQNTAGMVTIPQTVVTKIPPMA